MAKLDRDQIQRAIDDALPGRYRIVDADDGDVDGDGDTAEPAADRSVPASTLEAIRSKYADALGRRSEGARSPIAKASQFVVVEPDDELVTDFKAPNRRVRVISSETGEIVAEQG